MGGVGGKLWDYGVMGINGVMGLWGYGVNGDEWGYGAMGDGVMG